MMRQRILDRLSSSLSLKRGTLKQQQQLSLNEQSRRSYYYIF